MSKMRTENKDVVFAALKFIEELYKAGDIPAYMFRNILREYCQENEFTEYFAVSLKKRGGDKACMEPMEVMD